MPPLDWTFLEAINLLQVAIVIVALYVITRLLMRFWPWLRKVMDLTAALAQLPDFIERTDLALHSQDLAIQSIYHETHQNNGSSLKDAVDRVEEGVKGIYNRLDGLEESVEELHETDEKLSDQIEEQTQPHRAADEKE